MSESGNSGGRRRRSRSRNRTKGNSANTGGGQQKQQKGRKQAPKVAPVDFWGDPSRLPEPGDGLAHAPNVRAVLTSLGRPPVSGQETAAEHWFSLVYERAAFLAGALAAAGGLDEGSTGDAD